MPLLGGCSSAAFYLQAACGQLDILTRRVPIEEALADDNLPDEVRSRLATAYAARRFAAANLALPDNDSYQTYADVERPYVLWNVFAAPEFSVEPRTWCFPFAGCVGYRGYFAEDAARAEVKRLQRKGFDAYHGGVGAYSTLGRFDDPILSTMLAGDEIRTVSVIFHELAHQVVYRPSDTPFSESFASFVEREGVRRYLAAQEQDGDYASYALGLDYQEQFAQLIRRARDGLARLYAQPLAAADMRARKAAALDQLRRDYAVLRQSWGGFDGYDPWFDRELNNAHLASVNSYTQWVGAFGQLLREAGGDLSTFYTQVQALAKADDDVVAARLGALRERANAAGE